MFSSGRTFVSVVAVVATFTATIVQTEVPATADVVPLAAICNKYCDGRDPSLAPIDRVSGSATFAGRQLALHFDDTDAMAWVSLQNGAAGDELWMDRSFDGGSTWASGARIGASTIPAGVTGWRSLMFNVDNWAGHGVGALRACGKPATSAAITCAAWARTTWNAYDRPTAAATALMMHYNYATGLFTTAGWWNSANALTAIIENSRVTGLAGYRYAIANTYDKQLAAYRGSFRNDFVDDTGWWGMAWVAAYDLTKDARYLATARADADFMHSYWDAAGCGGVYWRTSRTGKTAIANSLYLQLNAALSRRITGDATYRARAGASWAWWKAAGLVNAEGLVNDSVDNTTCRNAGTTMWTYNSGNLVGALTEYHRLTNDANALASARKVADALTTSARFNTNGVFREQCEPGCAGDGDGASFKGAAARGLVELNYRVNGAYAGWLTRQATTNYDHNRNRLDQYGYHWAGPLDAVGAARQHSVLDLLNGLA